MADIMALGMFIQDQKNVNFLRIVILELVNFLLVGSKRSKAVRALILLSPLYPLGELPEPNFTHRFCRRFLFPPVFDGLFVEDQ